MFAIDVWTPPTQAPIEEIPKSSLIPVQKVEFVMPIVVFGAIAFFLVLLFWGRGKSSGIYE